MCVCVFRPTLCICNTVSNPTDQCPYWQTSISDHWVVSIFSPLLLVISLLTVKLLDPLSLIFCNRLILARVAAAQSLSLCQWVWGGTYPGWAAIPPQPSVSLPLSYGTVPVSAPPSFPSEFSDSERTLMLLPFVSVTSLLHCLVCLLLNLILSLFDLSLRFLPFNHSFLFLCLLFLLFPLSLSVCWWILYIDSDCNVTSGLGNLLFKSNTLLLLLFFDLYDPSVNVICVLWDSPGFSQLLPHALWLLLACSRTSVKLFWDDVCC